MVTIESDKNAYKTTDTSGDTEAGASELTGIVMRNRTLLRKLVIDLQMVKNRKETMARQQQHPMAADMMVEIPRTEYEQLLSFAIIGLRAELINDA